MQPPPPPTLRLDYAGVVDSAQIFPTDTRVRVYWSKRINLNAFRSVYWSTDLIFILGKCNYFLPCSFR